MGSIHFIFEEHLIKKNSIIIYSTMHGERRKMTLIEIFDPKVKSVETVTSIKDFNNGKYDFLKFTFKRKMHE